MTDNTETAAANETPTTDTPATEKKSIVPARYGNKYKDGGNDALANFINEQCKGKDGFEYTAFFTLCRKNIGGSLTEEKIAHYESQVAENRHGSQGRARMTLRNMLATLARKNGKLVGVDGAEHNIDLPKPSASGPAGDAQKDSGDGLGIDGTAGLRDEEKGAE